MRSPLLRCMWEIRRVLEREGIVSRAGLVAYLGESPRNDGSEGEAFSAGTVYQALHVLVAGREVMLWRTSDPYETLVLHQNAPWTG
ncbi:hypothetical protein KQI52_00030 [bacterium]|nr:hypothetical protein [bacterium]